MLTIEPVSRQPSAVSRPTDVAERLWIVDGTLVPLRGQRVAAFSRNYWFLANVQVVVNADTRLVIAAARPVPGTTVDVHALAASGLSRH